MIVVLSRPPTKESSHFHIVVIFHITYFIYIYFIFHICSSYISYNYNLLVDLSSYHHQTRSVLLTMLLSKSVTWWMTCLWMCAERLHGCWDHFILSVQSFWSRHWIRSLCLTLRQVNGCIVKAMRSRLSNNLHLGDRYCNEPPLPRLILGPSGPP